MRTHGLVVPDEARYQAAPHSALTGFSQVKSRFVVSLRLFPWWVVG